MPKSKRDKKISLTRTEKKPGLETKAALVEKVRGAVDNYARIFVFQVWNYQNIPLHMSWISKYSPGTPNILLYSLKIPIIPFIWIYLIHQVENMRNNKLKTVREKWSHSKFFIGKNRVLSKALGGTQEEEYAEGLSMVARYACLVVCLVFQLLSGNLQVFEEWVWSAGNQPIEGGGNFKIMHLYKTGWWCRSRFVWFHCKQIN